MLLTGEAEPAPRVCFRLKARRKLDDESRQQMRQSARYWALLAPFLPEQFCRSSFIRNPSLEYVRVQSEATSFRQELGLARATRDVACLGWTLRQGLPDSHACRLRREGGVG
jgi:hypothetical protein